MFVEGVSQSPSLSDEMGAPSSIHPVQVSCTIHFRAIMKNQGKGRGKRASHTRIYAHIVYSLYEHERRKQGWMDGSERRGKEKEEQGSANEKKWASAADFLTCISLIFLTFNIQPILSLFLSLSHDIHIFVSIPILATERKKLSPLTDQHPELLCSEREYLKTYSKG